jgi:hypothetical protein
MFRQRLQLITFTLIALGLVGWSLPGATQAQTDRRCFPETGFCIEGRIREFWEQNGGLPVFGFPIAPQGEELIEGRPFQVQWFQRNRLELHPENARPYDVLLGRLGADRLNQQGRDWQTFPRSTAQAGCRFFAETGHNVCGGILNAWRANGLELDGRAGKTEAENLALFGLPLSDAQAETLSDGRQYIVQWFERGRFELHPENAAPFDVLLGLLGNEIRNASGGAQPPPTADPCADVPEPINGRIRPGKCVKQGDPLIIDVFGFQPNEQVGFWLNLPDGSIFGSIETVDIGPTGSVEGLPLDTELLPAGLWSLVFEGTASKHQAVVYFKVSEP